MPGNAFIGHDERFWVVTACSIDRDGTEDSIVENGVGNQTAGVICFSVGCQFQRITGAAVDCAVALGIAFELIGVKRLDVSSVVLIEIREFIVEVYVRSDVVWNAELKSADSCVCDVDCAVRRSSRFCPPAPLWPGEV